MNIQTVSTYLLRHSRRTSLLALTVFLSLLCSGVAYAQSGQASLSGQVRDAQGAAVADAAITIKSNETSVLVTSRANDQGAFSVRPLNPGIYTVTIEHAGFQTEVLSGITLGAAQDVNVTPILKVGNVSESVTVTADALQVTTTVSEVSTTVAHEIVQDLPYPERSALGAVLLVPGVTGDPSTPGGVNSENAPITTGPITPGASISVGGAPPGTSSILVDGSDITQASYARAGINLSGQIIQETTVITTGMSAKYGRTGGGVIVQASKGGTNDYHGRITWRHTDPFFNAFPLGSSAANAQRENFYGFFASGPIRIPWLYNGRNKSFFFVGIEPARIQNALSYRGNFSTPDELAGRMHNALVLLNQTVLKNQGYAAALAAPRVGGIYSTSTLDANGFPNGAQGSAASHQFSGASGVDDISSQLAKNSFAQYVFSQLPTPQNPGPYIRFDDTNGSYQSDGTNGVYRRGVNNIDNRWSVRFDHQFNNSNQIFVRYSEAPLSGPRFFALSATNPLNQVPTDVTASHDLAIGLTHVFTSNVIATGRYSLLRVNQKRTPPAGALTKDFAAQYGLTPATAGRGFPTLGAIGGGVLQLAASSPYTDVDENFIGGGDFSWSHGNHLIQFGTEVRWIQSNQYDFSNLYGGRYAFAQSLTSSTGTASGTGGSSLASFILGQISSYTNTPQQVPGYYRWRYNAIYFQDDWRITPVLTLNLGIRYEVETPRREKFNHQAIVLLNQNMQFGTGYSSNAAFCFSDACGLPQTLWPTNWNGFEPRIGFSYAATPRLTVRGAYSMMRLPLTGYENLPDPNLNVAGQSVTSTSGGADATRMTNYITNPIGTLSSAYTDLQGARGPIATAQGFSPVYVQQVNSVPYTQNYNLTLQYEIKGNTLVQATYQGLKGTHLIGAFTGSINVPTIATLTSAVGSGAYLARSAANIYGIKQNGAVVAETGLQALNPYQNFFNQNIPELYPRRGTNQYHSMYLSVLQHLGRNFSLIGSYTWSKSMDNVPDTTAGSQGNFGSSVPQDPSNPFGEWAVSSYDQPSRLRVGYQASLPFGKNQRFQSNHRWVNALIGNISTSGIVTAASGYPNYVILGSTGYFTSFTPKGTGGCTTTNYCASSALPTGYVLRPDIVPGVPLINPNWKKNPFGLNSGSFTPYLNSAAFAVPGTLNQPRLGNAPRTLTGARTPREFLFDARVKKGFQIRDRYALNLTATFNNALNHPAYFAANNTANDPLQTSVTNVTSGATPSITFNPASTTFGKLNVSQISGMSRVIRIGAEFVF